MGRNTPFVYQNYVQMKQNLCTTRCTMAVGSHPKAADGGGHNLLRVALLLVMLFAIGFYSAEAQQSQTSQEDRFAALMAKAKWRETPMKFSYPNFFGPSKLFDDDVPAQYYLYTWHKVVMGYAELGAWAVPDDTFPAIEQPLIAGIEVKSITYQHKGKGIYSGFTTDNRVFYVKCKPTIGGQVTHLMVLAVVYPKSFQKGVEPLIKQIANW